MANITTVSPLVPAELPVLSHIEGVKLSSMYAAIRYKTPRPDLLLIEFAEGTKVAGVFTTSLTAAAPVDHCRQAIATSGGRARALLVNAGNANAFTGKLGKDAVEDTLSAVTNVIGCKPEHVMVASTGVIGEVLPADKISAAIPELHHYLKDDATAWELAARAIMTTDTFPKCAVRKVMIDGIEITVSGFAKGSGMIAPNMATMLAFIFTDAAISPEILQQMLTRANDLSFNSITVDSDTSTNDTALLFATGTAGNFPMSDMEESQVQTFQETLNEVMLELAHLVVKDGEGATKFITIQVSGAESDEAARRIGLSIGNSPLVKTAIAGCDPNWGRIVMAVGKAGERADRDKLSIWLGDILIAKEGQLNPAYQEAQAVTYMKGSEIGIKVDVGIGQGMSTVWTCDLTHRYIEINADYRS